MGDISDSVVVTLLPLSVYMYKCGILVAVAVSTTLVRGCQLKRRVSVYRKLTGGIIQLVCHMLGQCCQWCPFDRKLSEHVGILLSIAWFAQSPLRGIIIHPIRFRGLFSIQYGILCCGFVVSGKAPVWTTSGG